MMKKTRNKRKCDTRSLKKNISYRIGVSSECEDGDHILMMDFDIDHKEIGPLYLHAGKVQDKYRLPDMYFFKTKNGFHIYCVAKLSLENIKRIYDEFIDYRDNKHFEFGDVVCKRYVLRVGDEIEYYMMHGGYRGYYHLSTAHILLLHVVYGVPFKNKLNYDGLTELILERYTQPNKDAEEVVKWM